MKDHAEILSTPAVQAALGNLLEDAAARCNLAQGVRQRLRLAVLGELEQGLEVKSASAMVQAILEALDISPELHQALVRMSAEMTRAALEGNGEGEPRGIFAGVDWGAPEGDRSIRMPVTASAEAAAEYDLEVELDPRTNRGPMRARAD